ncbi:MAG: T9SS type A sorting domain-containing protein [Bacteroidetes bacterium]|nr:T9SS type A sorting domain-containing protein [Bacteroidota bacterium]
MYARTKTIMPNPVTITINGNATFDNSVVMFDSCLTSTATHNLIFKGNKVNYNDNVVFDHKAHLSTRLVFGSIQYDKAGTITTRRNGPVFDIRQVKQIITAGTIVDFSASPYDLMIASHSSSIATTHTALNINGTLNMGEKMIVGRSEPNYYSSINVNSGARLITAHANGLYSGTAAASCIYPLVNTSYRMNFFLHSASTVEYNGIDNQIVSGTGIGIATTTNHRYGNLDINFQGTADVEFAHPATDSVQVRTALILTGGELNLDDDHTTNTGGYTLQLLNGAIITRNSGYIRSEVEDGTGAVKWNITTNGSFVVPFGYNSTEFIPFTYQPVAGSSGDVVLATYHSAADNTPYPPTVSHVRDLTGADNSVNTVDRYWRIEVSGGATSNLTFSFTNAERSGIVNPRAQLWEPVSLGWFPPTGVQSNPTANTTLASTLTALNTWWTLSSALTPLPVELLSFNAIAESKIVRLDWTTASEINNDFFTVERSADGETFNVVTEVDGAGTSSIVHDYRAYDKTPLYGINYYRIKQTDFDGNATWSEVKKIKFVSNSTVSVYPNPIIGNVISIISKDDQEVVSLVSLYDLAGKLILKMDQDNLGSDNGVAQLEIGNYLADGAYLWK